MKTEAAFSLLIGNPYYWQKTGASQSLRRYYLHRIRHGLPVLMDTKMDLLKKAGFNIVIEMRWLVS
jgi:hypothetical protein